MVAALSLGRCAEPPAVTPVVVAEPEPLHALLPWTTVSMVGAARVERLRHDPRTALSFAVDAAAGRIHILDELMTHSGERLCVDPQTLLVEHPGMWQEDCGADEVSLHRGYVEVSQPVDVAIDPEGLDAWVVTAQGLLVRVELDSLAGHPFGWLRADEPLETGLDGVTSAVWSEGHLWVTNGSGVHRLDGTVVVQSIDAEQARLLDGTGGIAYLDRGGLVLPGGVHEAQRAASAGGVAVWWADGVVYGSDGWSAVVPDLPDALAVDPRTGTAYLLGGGDLRRVAPDGSVRVLGQEGSAVLVTATHDVVVAEGGHLDVFVDETSLIDERPPIHVVSLTALEAPNMFSVPIACDGEQSIGANLGRAGRNAALLDSVEGSWGVAVSARFAEGVHACGEYDAFAPWLDGSWELGVMLHQPSGCDDRECYELSTAERASQVWQLGVRPTWAASFHGTDQEWVTAVRDLGIDRYLLFGAGLVPGLPRDDLRRKQGWPVLPGDGPVAFTAEGLTDVTAAAGGVGLMGLASGCVAAAPSVALYPGLNRAAFAMDGCAGLLYLECALLERHSGVFSERDLRAIGLSLRHALARRDDRINSWTWHLADLNTYDYTDGCTWEQGELIGDCEGQYVNSIVSDIQRFVDHGGAAWASPSGLPTP